MATDIFYQIEDGALAVMMQNWSLITPEQLLHQHEATEKAQSSINVQDGVAVIPIQGMITPQADFLSALMGGNTSLDVLSFQLTEAMSRKDVEGIVFDVSSGGGRASGIDQMASMIFQAGKVKPIIAQVNGAAGSAAYYLASQASKIFLDDRTTMVGSIGTRVILTDTSEAAAQQGARVIAVDTGNMKSAGTPGLPITDEQVAVVQAQVDVLQGYFEESVHRGRPQVDMSKVTSGEMFLGEQSVELGLADAIQPLHVTVRQLKAKMEINSKASFVSKF